MNIDMGALHAIVVERGISFDDLLEDVKAAVLSAYRHTEGHQPDAHIDAECPGGVDDGLGTTDGAGRTVE